MIVPILASLLMATLAPQRAALRFDQGHEAREIPFELNSNKIYLSARVNGSGPLSLVLDSGAPQTMLDMEVAKRLGLPISDLGTAGGAGEGHTEVGSTKIDSVQLPGLTFSPPESAAIGVNRVVGPFEGRNLQGMIGGDFLAASVVEIDYEARKITVRDPETFHYTGKGHMVPISLKNGYMFAQVTLKPEGKPQVGGTFLVDTGVRHALYINTPFVDRNRLLQGPGKRLRATVGGGLGGEVVHQIGRLDWLKLGSLEIDRPVVSFSQDKQGAFSSAGYDGILGAEILKRFRTIVDYPHGRLILEPTASSRKPIEFDASGLFLVCDPPSFTDLRVLSVIAGSPADEAGIQRGDRITEIDGKPAPPMGLEAVRALLMRAGSKVSLTLVRDGRAVEKTLSLRRIV